MCALWFDTSVTEAEVQRVLASRGGETYLAFGASDTAELHQLGAARGVPVGTLFSSRHDLRASGTHCLVDGGVHTYQGQVFSLLSDGFNTGPDDGDEIAYEFTGKRAAYA